MLIFLEDNWFRVAFKIPQSLSSVVFTYAESSVAYFLKTRWFCPHPQFFLELFFHFYLYGPHPVQL